MPLTKLAVQNARPREKSWKLFDEKGLYLLITPRGSKLWQFKYRLHGKEKKLSLGKFPEVDLPTARTKREKARAIVADGKDPARERKVKARSAKLAAENTFEAIAKEYLAKREADGLSNTTLGKARWLLSLLQPAIGSEPITEITTLDLLSVLQDVQSSGRRETGRRLRSFASRVFDWAVITGRAAQNPALSLGRALIVPRVHHHAAIVEPRLFGELLRAIEGYSGYPSTVGALRLTPHVFQRPGEIRLMRWEDVDFERAKWTIPAETMKMRRTHEVALSRQALSIIRSMEGTARGSQYVFPAFHSPKRPLSENSVNQALRRLGYGGKMTAHGFRSTASSLLNETGEWNPDAIERSLAHQDANQIRATYNRTAYWNERVEMMQWWSDYLDQLKANTE